MKKLLMLLLASLILSVPSFATEFNMNVYSPGPDPTPTSGSPYYMTNFQAYVTTNDLSTSTEVTAQKLNISGVQFVVGKTYVKIDPTKKYYIGFTLSITLPSGTLSATKHCVIQIPTNGTDPDLHIGYNATDGIFTQLSYKVNGVLKWHDITLS